ncbi:MAG: asparagine synthase (glutamine-hydrolyzing), partial [Candidatus Hermodarchaeota archaeon]
TGNQPMHNTDKSIYIVFNGEIYNFQDLKKIYCKDYKFRSTSDTEVILAMYQKFGEECVHYFNGMWAFCIFDLNKNILFCSRDRLGIKPFYYYHQKDKFIFSSEIKSILEHNINLSINPKSISSFLRYRYVLEEETFFSKIYKLKPGNNLVFDFNTNEIKINEYWDLKHAEIIDSFNSQKDLIEQELIKSVEYRLIADVKVGSILSGGLDSSLTTAIMAMLKKDKINTYTVKFTEYGFDETPFARIVAEKYQTNHNELLIDNKNFLSIMDDYIKFKDEPIGVPNEIALYQLYNNIKKTASVVLAGEGADEIFAGYGRIFRSPFDYLKKTIIDNEINFLDFFLDIYGYFSNEDLKDLLKDNYYYEYKKIFKTYMEKCPRDYYNKISYIFLKIHLPGLLMRSDNSSMASAVESRVPFLDHTFVQIVYRLPFEYKNKFKDINSLKKSIDLPYNIISEEYDDPKYILKKIGENYLQKEIINRKKQGFPLPLNKWFGENYITSMIELLVNHNNYISNYFDIEKFKIWIERNRKDFQFGQKLWMIYSLEIWLKYMKENYQKIVL